MQLESEFLVLPTQASVFIQKRKKLTLCLPKTLQLVKTNSFKAQKNYKIHFVLTKCARYQLITLFRQECVSILQFPDNSTELCNFQLKSPNVPIFLSLQTHQNTHTH